jgi:signal transduction histidine kinase
MPPKERERGSLGSSARFRRPTNTDGRFSSRKVIVATLAVVVAAFVGGSGFSEYRTSRTHALTAEIATDESPSIEHLAAARAELRDLQRLLNTHVLQASTGQATETETLKQVRGRLRSDLEAYLALPKLPAERALWERIDKKLVDVDVLAGRILEETAARRFDPARALLVDQLPAAIDDEADAIITAIQFNAARVREVAGEIEGERRSRLLWVFGLDAVSVALAVALALLALRLLAAKEAIARRRAEELEGFAGRVAHDLLSPIAAVEMSVVTATRTEGPRRTTALGVARRGLERARGLIDDLLSFAQAGARPTQGATALVPTVLDGVLEEIRQPALDHGVTIEVPRLQRALAVSCAPGVLASLLGNLMRNAIKHMGERPRREVRVAISVSGSFVRFEVADTGPGLPPGPGRDLFEPYVRGAGTSTPGLGLGLATVRRLVEGHNGHYGVRSRAGLGALFWFELPMAALRPEEVDQDDSEDEGTRGDRSLEPATHVEAAPTQLSRH